MKSTLVLEMAPSTWTRPGVTALQAQTSEGRAVRIQREVHRAGFSGRQLNAGLADSSWTGRVTSDTGSAR